jgi:very-short-patch-repair endonuclease
VDVLRTLRKARLPEPKLQYLIRDARGPITRGDYAWIDQKVVLFADGWAFHHDRASFERDREQRERLAASGWTPVVVTSRALTRGSWLASLTRHLRRAV